MHYNVTVDTPENSNVYLYQNITLTNFLAARDLIINITSTILDLTCDAFGIRFGFIRGKLLVGRNSKVALSLKYDFKHAGMAKRYYTSFTSFASPISSLKFIYVLMKTYHLFTTPAWR